MILFLCGLIIGVVMGLTGAGGAIIAIPLFMQFLEMGLKEASIFSLVAAALASFLNLLSQRNDIDLPLALWLFFPSLIGSYVSALFKPAFPLLGMKILLGAVCAYALFAVWFPSRSVSERKAFGFYLPLVVGLSLGVLTTLTGLGGGVLLLPVLLSVFGLPHPRAVATSLVAVSLASVSSLGIQLLAGGEVGEIGDILILAGGILVSAVGLRYVLARLRPEFIQEARKIVFALVVIIALGKIFTGGLS